VAVRSIIDIDVNDEKFKAFAENFSKYQAKLDETGGAWANIDKDIQKALNTVLSAFLALGDSLKVVDKREKDFANDSKKTGVVWHDLVKSTKGVATNIKDATLSLLRWASIGSVISGLTGAGSLFGLDMLAAGVGGTRRQALGLGTTYGEKKAFDVNLGRIVDTDQFLSGVNAALHDVSQRPALYGAGLTTRDLQGKDTAEVSAELIASVKNLVDRTNPALLGQLLSSRHLDQLFTLQQLEALRGTPKGEIAEYLTNLKRDAIALNVKPRDQKAWQDFQVALNRASQNIENVFVTKLGGLVTPLTHLSESVVKSIETLADSGKFKEWIDDLGHGIEGFAKYIGSSKFQTDITTFTTDVGLVAQALVNALKWLNIIPQSGEDVKKEQAKAAEAKRYDIEGKHQLADTFDFMTSPKRWFDTSAATRFQGQETSHRLPKGLLWNIYGAESAYGTREGRSSAGAEGPFQFMPKTAKDYHLDNVYDTKKAADAAGQYLQDLIGRYHGDVAKAIAAYNWGEGHLDRELKDAQKHHYDWRERIPDETKDYLKKVLTGWHLSQGVRLDTPNTQKYRDVLTKQPMTREARDYVGKISMPKTATPGVRIEILNNSGGNATVIASQLPQ
jgi:hypothetical protein